MAKQYIRTWTALLLLLAYLGQSLVVVGAPCGAADMPADAAMSAMDHSAHQMNADAGAAESCCEGSGFCSMSHCVSAAAVPVTALDTVMASGFSHTSTAPTAAPLTPRDSLFRPPISH